MFPRVLFIGGGTGTPKLIEGFRHILSDDKIAVIANTADDIILNGLYISPDVDSYLYLFSNLLDRNKYWGIVNDTYLTYNFLRKLNPQAWFNLGDKDLAVHLFRTQLLEKNNSLYYVTNRLSSSLGIKAEILPCTDNHIETRIVTEKGNDIHFQEYWVKHKGKIDIKDLYIAGKENTIIPERVFEIIEEAEKIIIGPSNPVTSVGPIIEIMKIREKLRKVKNKVIAISPIIDNRAISGPACDLMKVKKINCSSLAVCNLYSDIITTFIVDTSDKKIIDNNKCEVSLKSENIIFNNESDVMTLAKKLL